MEAWQIFGLVAGGWLAVVWAFVHIGVSADPDWSGPHNSDGDDDMMVVAAVVCCMVATM
jgi:hypothetical protein